MSVEIIKKLRDLTSLGIADCRKALIDGEGDFDKALEALKKRGIELLEKKKDRKTTSGLIESYIHFGGNLGALVHVSCETDFVAKTELFKKFAKDVAMHVAAMSPLYMSKEDVAEEELAKAEDSALYIKESCLLEQSFVKDSSKTIHSYLQEVVSQIGENIVIKRFSRFSLGENES